MAPGYRSPFDHHLPPSIANYNFYHPKATLLLFLAIILCVLSVIVYIELSTIRAIAEEEQHASFREQQQQQQQHGPKGGSPPPDMTLDRAAMMANHTAVLSGRDPQRVVDIRHLFPCDEGCVDVQQQPLLSPEGRTGSSLLEQDTYVVEMAARHDDVQRKGSIHWHGTNTLNTSWGWMA